MPDFSHYFRFNVISILEQENGSPNLAVLRASLFFLIREIRVLVNNPERITFAKTTDSTQALAKIERVLAQVSINELFNISGPDDSLKCGLWHLRASGPGDKTSPLLIGKIEGVDFVHRQIKVSVFQSEPVELQAQLGEREIKPVWQKTVSCDFLGKSFSLRRVMWLPYDASTNEPLSVITKGESIKLELGKTKKESFTVAEILEHFALVKTCIDSEDPNLWLIYDRMGKADDNGEHFYRDLKANHPEIDARFVLSSSSSDWGRLQAEGFKLVAHHSREHKRLILRCEIIISPHIGSFLLGHRLQGKLKYKRIAWLQHGVISSDMSRFINSFHTGSIELITTTTNGEYQSLIESPGRTIYGPREVKLLGLCRYDNLLRLASQTAPKRQILLQFT